MTGNITENTVEEKQRMQEGDREFKRGDNGLNNDKKINGKYTNLIS